MKKRGWIIALLLIAVALVVSWTTFNIVSVGRLNAALERHRAAGYPMELAEIAPPPIPESENASAHIKRACAMLIEPAAEENDAWKKVGDGQAEDLKASLTEAELKAIRRYLEKNQNAFEAFAHAATYPQCRNPIEYENGFSALLPHIAEVMKAAKALRVKAIVDLIDGRPDAAAESLAAGMALSDGLRSEPLLVSLLVRIVVDKINLGLLEQLMLATDLPADRLASIRARFDPADLRAHYAVSMKGELAFGISAFRSVTDGADDLGIGTEWQFSSFLYRPVLRLDVVRYLEIMRRMAELASVPYWQARAELEVIDADASARSAWKQPFTALLLPALGKASENVAKAEALRAVARAAIDLKLNNGEKRPIDPFTGAPVSVGEDAITAGGGASFRLKP